MRQRLLPRCARGRATSRLRIALLCVFALGLGCSEDTSQAGGDIPFPTPRPSPTPSPLAECTSVADCPRGERCNFGSCEAGPGCGLDGQSCDGFNACCEGSTCQAGRCAPPPPEPAKLEVSPDALEFGAVQVGAEAELTLTLRNTGDLGLTVGSIGLDALAQESGVFEIVTPLALPVTLGGDGGSPELLVELRFTPARPIVYRGNLLLTTSLEENGLVQIPLVTELKGEPFAALVEDVAQTRDQLMRDEEPVVVEAIDFGAVPLRAPATRALSVVNGGFGNVALEIEDVRIEPAGAPSFGLSVDPAPSRDAALILPALEESAPDAANTVVALSLDFAPLEAGPHTAELVIVSNDPLAPELRVPLVANAVAGALVGEPESLDLGRVFLGLSAEGGMGLVNAGTDRVVIDELRLDPPAGEGPITLTLPELDLPFTLEPEARIDGELSYAPTEVGAHRLTLTVLSDDPERPELTLEVTGTGAEVPVLTLDPSSLDFGQVATEERVELPLVLGNTGGSTVELSGLRLDPPAPAFTFAPAVLPGIPPGGTLAMTVGFRPDAVRLYQVVLAFESNDPLLRNVAIPLRGEGVEPERIRITPEEMDFGSGFIGRTMSRQLSIENVGRAELTVLSLGFSPSTALSFALIGAPAQATVLPASGRLDVDVRYIAGAGVQNGTVIVRTDVPGFESVLIPLGGAGIGCPPERGDIDGDPDTCEYLCPQVPPGPEICDDIDNDCDGATDEAEETGGCNTGGNGAPCADHPDCTDPDFPMCTQDPNTGLRVCTGFCNSSIDCGPGQGCYHFERSVSLSFCGALINDQAVFGQACTAHDQCPTGYCDPQIQQCLDTCSTSSPRVPSHNACDPGYVCQARDTVHRSGRSELHPYCVPVSSTVGLVPEGGSCFGNTDCVTGWCNSGLGALLPGVCRHICGSQLDCSPGIQHCEPVDGHTFALTGGALSGIQGCIGNVDEPRIGAFHQFGDRSPCTDSRQCSGGWCFNNLPGVGSACTSSCSSPQDCGAGWRCGGALVAFVLIREIPLLTLNTGEAVWTRVCLPPNP